MPRASLASVGPSGPNLAPGSLYEVFSSSASPGQRARQPLRMFARQVCELHAVGRRAQLFGVSVPPGPREVGLHDEEPLGSVLCGGAAKGKVEQEVLMMERAGKPFGCPPRRRIYCGGFVPAPAA